MGYVTLGHRSHPYTEYTAKSVNSVKGLLCPKVTQSIANAPCLDSQKDYVILHALEVAALLASTPVVPLIRQ